MVEPKKAVSEIVKRRDEVRMKVVELEHQRRERFCGKTEELYRDIMYNEEFIGRPETLEEERERLVAENKAKREQISIVESAASDFDFNFITPKVEIIDNLKELKIF